MNILNKLTIKHLKMNKKRTIVTIIGVVLSTALMVGIGLLFSTVRDYMIREISIQNGTHHVKIIDFDYRKKDILDNDKTLKKVGYEQGVGFAVFPHSQKLYKPYLYIDSGNDVFLNSLHLKTGRLPLNSHELVISEHILSEYTYKIGDTLNLDFGVRYANGEEINSNNTPYKVKTDIEEEETFVIKGKQQYTIVGVVERSFYESYFAPGYQFYTKMDNLQGEELVTTYLTYKNIANVYNNTDLLVEKLGLQINGDKLSKVEYNESLLTIYGKSKYSNLSDSFIGIILIILALISVGCIVVIYNSFAISVMERKKQFGLFSSIGATKAQLRKTVFYEAFIVGIIGITIGLVSGILGIWVVLQIINNLLSEMFTMNLQLAIYPLFVIIPVVFMIIVIIFSAYLPAHKASKITPIEAIRLNDDIKIKGKKIKTSKFISKIFGIEAEIATKNMKRNKRKYRITIISLFMSIVLFISFSSLLIYTTRGSSQYLNDVDFDIMVSINDEDENLLKDSINDIINTDEVDKSIVYKNYYSYTTSFSNSDYHKDFSPILKEQNNNTDIDIIWNHLKGIMIISIDDANYKSYLKELGLKKEQPIFINQFNSIIYTSKGERKSYEGELLESKKDFEFSICDLEGLVEKESVDETLKSMDCSYKVTNIYETTIIPFGFEYLVGHSVPIIIVSNDLFNTIITEQNKDVTFNDYTILIKADEYTNLDKKIHAYIDQYKVGSIFYNNIQEEMKMMRNLIMVIKILFYGFIALVTLIGVTSVFNTINTSIALRRTEFAMLRSMGLTPKGFNRILRFETLIVGLKSLFYALPVSFGVVYLIDRSMGKITSFSEIIIPWNSICIAIIGVFIIVSITMQYATKKIKKDNILDAIREENI